MTRSPVDQLLVAASIDDRATSIALRLSASLAAASTGELYAVEAEFDCPAAPVVLVADRRDRGDGRFLLYHGGSADNRSTRALLESRSPVVVYWHSSAAGGGGGRNCATTAGDRWGVYELGLIRDRVALAIADSDAAAAVLEAADLGGAPVLKVAPWLPDTAARIGGSPPHPSATSAERSPYVLLLDRGATLGQTALLVQAMSLIQSVHRTDVGLTAPIGRVSSMARETIESLGRRLRLRHAYFPERPSAEQMVDLVAGAALVVCHRSGAWPTPLAALAMACNVPVVALTSCANDHSLDGAYPVRESDGPIHLAEVLDLMITDDATRRMVQDDGDRTLAAAAATDSLAAVVGLLEGLCG